MVQCGSKSVALQVFLCPIYYNGYNESLLALNSQHRKNHCKGIADWTVDPPVLRFNFSITKAAIVACSTKLTVGYLRLKHPADATHTTDSYSTNFFSKLIQGVGGGLFADFSNIQKVNISGSIHSEDSSTGAITYNPKLMYMFSCDYPLQYLVNQTQMSV